ncbi:hypothetical protein [Streptomyces cylindrosporus]|uniref:Uncharacterized protein n=1 Tax=Streptomyces cylindrosporus TaxID=2927583 RepID=A0ABS9YAH5_9ACTN|nr:hypothetical protein [Streptomyces cylindrosporus]MCI3273535.1 hypothetical protein [Streptomyces cylindrosporus]
MHTDLLFPADAERTDEGPESWSVVVGCRTAPEAVTGPPASHPDAPPLQDHIVIDFAAMDRWFEEDEPLYAGPRDPYHRVDVGLLERSGTVSECLYTGDRERARWPAVERCAGGPAMTGTQNTTEAGLVVVTGGSRGIGAEVTGCAAWCLRTSDGATRALETASRPQSCSGRRTTMARMLVKGDDLVVRLAWWEKAAVRRRDVRVPLAAVRRVTVEPDWWRALRGIQEQGRCVPGALCLGTRRHQGGTDFVAVRPGRPVVCLELWPSAPFRLLAVAARDEAEGRDLADRLRRSAPEVDSSTRWRQPLPVPEETDRRSAGMSLLGPATPDETRRT